MRKIGFAFVLMIFAFVFAACDSGIDNEISYKVIHMQQNIEDDGYTVVDEETFSGTVGSRIKIQTKAYEGFSAKPVEEQVVKEGLSVSVYYDRNLVTFDFNLAGGTAETTIVKKYGTPVTKEIIPDPVKGTSKFSFWSPALPETFTEDATFTANWDYSSYKVKFMFQNAEDDDYSQDTGASSPQETFYGNSGDLTAYEAPFIKGFELNRVEQARLGDEEQTVTVYYDRTVVTLLIDVNGGEGTSLVKGRMGSSFTESLLGTYTKKGYVFEGFDKELPETFKLDDNNKTILKVLWRGEGEARYSVRFYYENLDRTVEPYSENKEYTVKAIGKIDNETAVQVIGNAVYVEGDKCDIEEGFHPVVEGDYAFKNEVITGNETTLIKVYCDRNVSTYKLNLANGTYLGSTDPIVITGRYGEDIVIPEAQRPGYHFVRGSIPEKFPAVSVNEELNYSWEYNKFNVVANENVTEEPYTTWGTQTFYAYKTTWKDTKVARISKGKLDRPYHKITGISKTPDGEIDPDLFFIESNTYFCINIAETDPIVDGGNLNYYCHWKPVEVTKVGGVNATTLDVENKKLSFYIYAIDDRYNGETNYSSSALGGQKGKIFAYVDDVFIGSELNNYEAYSSTKINFTDCNIDNPNIDLRPSTKHTLRLELGLPYRNKAGEIEYFMNTPSPATKVFHVPINAATEFELLEEGTDFIKLRWRNPESADGIKSVEVYRNAAYGDMKAWSSTEPEDCKSGDYVTATVTGLSAREFYECYVKVTDVYNQSRDSEKLRVFTSDSNGDRKHGQIYYSDNTWASNFVEGKIPVGIVCEYTDGKPSKILGLKPSMRVDMDHLNNLGLRGFKDDGTAFAQKVIELEVDYSKLEAFNYCYNYTAGPNNEFTEWYLPSYTELVSAIYGEMYVKNTLEYLKNKNVDAITFDKDDKYFWDCYMRTRASPNNSDWLYSIVSIYDNQYDLSSDFSNVYRYYYSTNSTQIGVIPMMKVTPQ